MKTAIVSVRSLENSPYSQGRYHNVPKLPKELPRNYEERTWREKLHYIEKGNVFIPAVQFKKAIEIVGKYLGQAAQIPGGGKSTYTKHFVAGVMAFEPLILPLKKNEVEGLWLFVPSDGKKGGSKRVEKCFPIIRKWEGTVKFIIVDDMITQDVFYKFLTEAGSLIGIGVFRPERGGYYGRFEVIDLKWQEK